MAPFGSHCGVWQCGHRSRFSGGRYRTTRCVADVRSDRGDDGLCDRPRLHQKRQLLTLDAAAFKDVGASGNVDFLIRHGRDCQPSAPPAPVWGSDDTPLHGGPSLPLAECHLARLASAYSGISSGKAVISQPCDSEAAPDVWKSGSADAAAHFNVGRRRQAAAFFLLGLPLRACPKPMALASSERRLA